MAKVLYSTRQHSEEMKILKINGKNYQSLLVLSHLVIFPHLKLHFGRQKRKIHEAHIETK